MNEKPNYYIVIPAEVRYSDLSDLEKLLYGEIGSLCSKEGYCWATNEYFQSIYSRSERQISRCLANIQAKGFISIKVEKTESGSKRTIHPTKMSMPLDKNVYTPQTKMSSAYSNNISNNIYTNVVASPVKTSFVCKEDTKPTMPRNWLPDILTHYGNEQGWTEKPNATAYKRFARAVKDLWSITGGDMFKAKKTISWVKAQKYPSWSLDTCVKRYYDANKKSKAELLPEL